MAAPHLLRYLAVAVIIAKRKRHQVPKELIRVVTQEAYQYSDPVTKFIECIYSDFDFEQAQSLLVECGQVLDIDPFLLNYKTQFMESARQVVFETYCKLHTRISLGSLASSLNLEYDEAEKWIANLIQNVRLDAKIDSNSGYVVMGVQGLGVMDQLMERSKAVALRTVHLASAASQHLS